jgi:hypothetical protein
MMMMMMMIDDDVKVQPKPPSPPTSPCMETRLTWRQKKARKKPSLL